MHSARYYALEAAEMRRAMYDARDDKLRTLLSRVARAYEELAAEIEGGEIKHIFPSIDELQPAIAAP